MLRKSRNFALAVFAIVANFNDFSAGFQGLSSTSSRASSIRHPRFELIALSSSNVNEIRDDETSPFSSCTPSIKKDLDLLELVLINADTVAAEQLLMKNRGNPQQQAVFFDQVLSNGPDQRLPLWTKLRFMTGKSRRARWASLRRTLTLTTPPSNADEGDGVDSAEDQARRRRRALVSLLRAVASKSVDFCGGEEGKTSHRVAIRVLETTARRESRGLTEDMISRRPGELETPKYSVIIQGTSSSDKNFEIRSYDPFSVCSVDVGKPRLDSDRTDEKLQIDPKTSSAQAFGALAGYLFGKNEQESAMKMTTPVLMNGQGDEKQMSFVLPSNFWGDDGVSVAPRPLDGSGVRLERMLGGNRAVVMFGGYASKGEVEKQKRRLFRLLQKNKDWIAVEPEISVAQYNDPFTPPWKRLNEVSVAVEKR